MGSLCESWTEVCSAGCLIPLEGLMWRGHVSGSFCQHCETFLNIFQMVGSSIAGRGDVVKREGEVEVGIGIGMPLHRNAESEEQFICHIWLALCT